MSRDRVFDITKVVENKLEQQENAIDFAKQNIVILDDAGEPYYAALNNVDASLYKSIEEVNDTLVAVTSAYQERINVGCRTDLFWVQTGITTIPAGPGEYVTQYSYKCVSINYVGYSTTHTLPIAVGVGTTTGAPIPNNYGYAIDNLHGLKVYNEPYMEDLLSTYVGSGIGTIGAGSTALYIMAPIETGGIQGLEVGQIVQSSKQLIFPGNVNTIVAIGTTTRDLSTIPSSGVTIDSSTINVLYLKNPAVLSAKNPEDDNTYVTFTVLIDPDNIPDDFALEFGAAPYTPQTVNMMGSNTIGAGSSIAYVNNGDSNVSIQWNQFLNGFQDPSDIRPGKIVNPPQVGAGITHYRVGFSSRPAVYNFTSFDHYAVEGETINTLDWFGSLFPSIRNVPISISCTAQENALTNAIAVKNNKESEFSSGLSTFTSTLNLSNALREDLSELNLRIWAYRMQIGKAKENRVKYNSFSSVINDPKNKNLING
jgi:hypothetical protein